MAKTAYAQRAQAENTPAKSKTNSTTNSKTAHQQTTGLEDFLGGAAWGGVASFVMYATKAASFIPIPYDINMTDPVSNATAMGFGYIAGSAKTQPKRIAGLIGVLASYAPEVQYAMATSDYKHAGMMAGVKGMATAAAYIVGEVKKRLS
ncbi:hypothetical protein HN695_07950 [Candidatus Woesearchaeota archaeon]|nr:hypothetical protein [Candidatus Woesearchaeota archaeon]MBT5272474.1 hypothetical protein [Candidatus Woesearchaeota archaeon]MBT6041518.1 hypothetical protein [Candidatus Woesearchaeota archaeon]MBT6336336.1 hypothetical protein [Candidatus Woesearchaeota archaeon]MBT7928238.1 hypothetical protein [Candidatus Woesearchaeota archaeon]